MRPESPSPIEHRASHHRFVALGPEGDAVLAYRITAAGPLDIRSVYVPAEARGRGIAGSLVEAAFAYAQAENRRVIPTCWYVGRWVADHPEFRELLVPGAAEG